MPIDRYVRKKHYSPLDGRPDNPDGTSHQAQLRVNEIPGRTRLSYGLHLERQGIFVIWVTWMLSVVSRFSRKVNKACRRARITMKLDERSRLPDEDECAKGYLRISPFMNETK